MKRILCIAAILLFAGPLFAQDQGYLKFELNTDSAFLVIDFDYANKIKITSGDSFRLPAGVHHINVSTPFDHELKMYQEVFKDSTKVLSLTFRDNNVREKSISENLASVEFFKSNIFVITDDDSEIFFNNKSAGTGFAKTTNDIGYSWLTIRNPDFGSKTFSINATPDVSIFKHYRRPSKPYARTMSFVPGLSQFYKRQYFKAGIFSIATTSLFVASLPYIEPVEAFRKNDPETKRKRRILVGSTLLVYSLNILDAFISKPEGGFQKKKKTLEFYLSREMGEIGMADQATVRINL